MANSKIKQIQIGNSVYDIEPASSAALSVVNNAPTPGFGDTATIGSVNGTNLTVKIPATNSAAASGGTTVTLVTTGDKYAWNSKASGSHSHYVVATGGVDLGSNTTASGGVQYIEDVNTTNKSSYLHTGSVGVASQSHTHSVTPLGAISEITPSGTITMAAENNSTSTNTKFVQSINSDPKLVYASSGGIAAPMNHTHVWSTSGSVGATGTTTSVASSSHTHYYLTYSLTGDQASGTHKWMKANFTGTSTNTLVTGVAYTTTPSTNLIGSLSGNTLTISLPTLNVSKGNYQPSGSIALDIKGTSTSGYTQFAQSVATGSLALTSATASTGAPSETTYVPTATHTHGYSITVTTLAYSGTTVTLSAGTYTSKYIKATFAGSAVTPTFTGSPSSVGKTSTTATTVLNSLVANASTTGIQYITGIGKSTKYFHPSFSGTTASTGQPK